MPVPEWRWDEYQQVGVDYTDLDEVRRYDERMGQFRDFDGENRRVIERLGLKADDTLLEIGCGTGRFALDAARVARGVHAYDVSQPMLDYAAGRARAAGLTNIRFERGGFLSCHAPSDAPVDPPGPGSPCDSTTTDAARYPAVDVVVSQLALHHLPDFWKGVALCRVASLLKPGGRFLLTDVAFSFSPADHAEGLQRWIDSFPPGTRENASAHASREYSTQPWILEGLLRQAGLRIERMEHLPEHQIVQYVCRKDGK